MKLIYCKTEIEFEAEILPVEDDDFYDIANSKKFVFDWKKEKENQIFK